MSLRFAVAGCLLAALPGNAVSAAPGESAAEDYRVYLETAVFDPLENPPPVPPEAKGTERRIVQFREPQTRAQRQKLVADFGLELTLYVPNQAYVERLSDDELARLQRTGLVRAVVPYQPAFKVSTRIGTVPFRSPERRGRPGYLLRAVLFGDADPEAVAASIRRLPGATEVRALDFRADGAEA